MAHTMFQRVRGATPLEKGVYTLLIGLLAIDGAVIALGRPDDTAKGGDRAAEQAPAASTTQASEGGDTVKPCSAVRQPGPGDDPVTCRTRTATLTIAGPGRPAILGATQARVLRANLRGTSLDVTVRLRNETDAEQGVLAGGQEAYVSLGGVRVPPAPVGEVRLPTMTGKTVVLHFPLNPSRLRAIRRLGGRLELGLTPWTVPSSDGGRRIGVIRFTTRV